MMYQKSVRTPKGTLYYKTTEDHATVMAYSGDDAFLSLPSELSGLPLTKIAKKAFMNCKRLRRIELPNTISRISAWAFAYCGILEEVVFSSAHVTLGTGVFIGDKLLEKIVVDGVDESASVLLAAASNMEKAEYLLDISSCGQASWYAKWDDHLIGFLREPDDAGYTDLILCGEEDASINIDSYSSDKRREKVRLCFLRLLHADGLDGAKADRLSDYLRAHAFGAEENETWLLMKEEKGSFRDYYELYVSLGCLNEENLDDTLSDLGDKQPEMKAYFLRWKDENTSGGGFLDDLLL